MFDAGEYSLVDFGGGRKLERFGAELLDRPSPAATDTAVAQPGLWADATARYDGGIGAKGEWVARGTLAEPDSASWPVRHGDSVLMAQLGASGNVGLFAEQATNWDWLGDQVQRVGARLEGGRPRVLNLFGYTGAASLAAAAAGAEGTHVDASAPTVAWAKRNAEASGLAEAPLRWLVEDAMKFVRRECRRQSRYHGIIADPPTYGHGPKGKAFKFKQHLPELLERCAELLQPGTEWPEAQRDGDDLVGRFLLFSCHAPGSGTRAVRSAVERAAGDVANAEIDSSDLMLTSPDGRELPAGVSVRWTAP